MTLLATHSILLPAAPLVGEGGAASVPVPDWVQLVPAGAFTGVDGRGPWTLADADAVVVASALPLPVDEAHATDLGAAMGAAAPARGWIEELQARPDGIWGRVAWTGMGRALLAERAYRGISPTFAHTKAGQVTRLLRAALTNVPNLPQLRALNHITNGNPPHMDLLAQLRQLHGLPADADDAAALNACRTDRAAAAAHGVALNSIAAAAGLSPGQDASSLASAITAARAAAGDAGRMAGEMVSLQSQLNEMRATQAREKAVACVDGAMRAGKPIPRALRDHYIARHCQDPTAVETELAALPALNAGGITRPPAADGAPVVDEDERRVIAMMGIDPTKYAEAKKRLGEQVESV